MKCGNSQIATIKKKQLYCPNQYHIQNAIKIIFSSAALATFITPAAATISVGIKIRPQDTI